MDQPVAWDKAQMDAVRVLVLEDSALMAELIKDVLLDGGAIVVETRQSVAGAFQMLASQDVDLACLDVDLGTEDSFPVADEFVARCIPFVFVTGSRHEVLPLRHRHQPFVRKLKIAAELAAACRAATARYP